MVKPTPRSRQRLASLRRWSAKVSPEADLPALGLGKLVLRQAVEAEVAPKRPGARRPSAGSGI
eukprot:5524604-Alexandrium_andersonii.AAC.1